MSRLGLTLVLAVFLVLTGSSCGGSGGGDSEGGSDGDRAGGTAECVEVGTSGTEAAYMADYQVPPELELEPEITMDGCGDPPEDLLTEDIVTGEGPAVEESSTVTVNYLGVLWPDAEEFDSSWSRDEPASFPLDGVIPGWSQGLVGMKQGGRRLLVIPPDLAYGAQGAGGDIPPDSTLVFVVDVLEVEAPPEVPAALQEKPVVTIPAGEAPPTTLVITDEVVGTGAEARPGDEVTVNYVGVAWSTGGEFDASWENGQPATFTLGQLVPGFNQGVEGMKVGGRRRIVIPPDLAYGAQGRPPVIAPNETLVFVVDLLGVAPSGG